MPSFCRPALFAAALLMIVQPAIAQPVESEPLSAPYTLHQETDPMATGAAPANVAPDIEKNINRGETIIAPPPPGVDDYTAGSDGAAPAETSPPQSEERTMQPAQDNVVPSYPNNPVSGVAPQDESKFEKIKFCTLKVSFGVMNKRTDVKTAEKIKSYLDANADKVTYTRADKPTGEYSYCIDTNEHRTRGKIYTELKRLMPANGMAAAPVTLAGKGFETIESR